MLHYRPALIAILAAATYAPLALAQTDPEPDAFPTRATPAAVSETSAGVSSRDLAIIHYERGRTAYSSGRYRLAVYELETAYSLDPTGTNLLLNLGTVHERMGHIDDAILSYERLLAAASNAEERARTERVLTRLRGARVELADISFRRGRTDGLFWTVAGGAIAGGAIGVTMFLTQRSGANDDTAPIAFTVGGGALGVLALVLYFARDAPERRSLFVNIGAAPGAGTLGLAGTF